MKLNRQNKAKTEISTASLPDIIFMLLIFFMVTTVIKKYDGLQGIVPPKAEELKKIKNKNDLVYMWITKDGVVSIDDRLIHMDNISDIMSLKIDNNPKITVALKADETSVMSNVQKAHAELREAQALKINYHTKTKKKTGL